MNRPLNRIAPALGLVKLEQESRGFVVTATSTTLQAYRPVCCRT